MNDILYIIDYVNYNGGAHASAAEQIRLLIAEGRDVTIFSLDQPNDAARKRFSGCSFRQHPAIRKCKVFATPLKKVFLKKDFSLHEKILKLQLSLSLRRNGVHRTFEHYIGTGELDEYFNSFRYICVLSEGSALRQAAARCRHPFKIQWIHLDYEAWANDSPMAANTTKDDKKLFESFDRIIFISENSRNGFLKHCPDFLHPERLSVICNPIPCRKLEQYRLSGKREIHTPLQLVTIARLDRQKNIARCIRIAARLYQCGYQFRWNFIGDGRDRKKLLRQIKKEKLEHIISLDGYQPEPWQKGREADLFVLFSRFEGIPNVIFEAFLIGIPVIANAIAAIPEQIQNGRNGFLVENNEEAMFAGLKQVFDHPQQLLACKTFLADYEYDNATIEKQLSRLFSARKS